AMSAPQPSLATQDALVSINPQATEWQRDLAISLVKVADAIVETNREEARTYYERSRRIREQLAESDPTNLTAQRDLALIYDRIGNLYTTDERYEEALDVYRKSLAIRQKAAAVDQGNPSAKRDVAISHNLVATTLSLLDRIDDAKLQWRAGLAVVEDYAA